MWFEHLRESQYKLLKFINDNPQSDLLQIAEFLKKNMNYMSTRHVHRILTEFLALRLIDNNHDRRHYVITNIGRRALNLEKMFQDKSNESSSSPSSLRDHYHRLPEFGLAAD